jgi:uncharacterized protein YhaN
MDDLTESGQAAVQAMTDLPADEKKKAAQMLVQAEPGLFPKADAERTKIWVTLLAGLFFLAMASIVGAVIIALQGKDAASLFVLATAIVTGTIGLFAKSPV